jgi:lambda family phage minor tail protein L
MTDLIEVVQKQDPGSELISLFELTFNGTTLYFHPGLDENLDKLYFEDAASPHTIREYDPFPLEMTGVEYNADGATNRPTLSIANVTTLFSDSLGGLTNQDLIGSIIIVRQTLAKYLETSSTFASPGTGTLPIEFPKKKFILDRVAGETSISVTFEVSSPYDLQGVKIPNRQIIGKYCSWIYQGHDKGLDGGCIWKANSVVSYSDGVTVKTHKAYFDVDDNPLVTVAQLSDTQNGGHTGAKSYTIYSNSNPMVAEGYYEYGNTVWKALKSQASGASQIAPQTKSSYWVRGDVCGKKLSSCKRRFQFTPANAAATNSYPKTDERTTAILPFGSFPGTKKFR